MAFGGLPDVDVVNEVARLEVPILAELRGHAAHLNRRLLPGAKRKYGRAPARTRDYCR
jgi:hypothetical protein